MLAQIDGGGTYTAFDGEGRPVAGETAAGVDFTITYAADGSSVQRFEDGSSVSFDPGGTVVSQTTADGTTFTAFDGEGRPVAGETAAGDDFTITYAADGSSVQRFDDGSSVSFDPGGTVVSQTTVDGATFTPSDGGGQPADGLTAGENSFATSHGDGSSDGPTGDGTAVSDYPSATTEVETPAAATAPATGRGGNGTFQVDLAALGSAIGGVSGQRDAIDGGLSTLRTTFSNIEQVWQSPSGATFSNLVTDFNAASDELLSLLRESIDRMRSAHATYSATEATNVRNLQ